MYHTIYSFKVTIQWVLVCSQICVVITTVMDSFLFNNYNPLPLLLFLMLRLPQICPVGLFLQHNL